MKSWILKRVVWAHHKMWDLVKATELSQSGKKIVFFGILHYSVHRKNPIHKDRSPRKGVQPNSVEFSHRIDWALFSSFSLDCLKFCEVQKTIFLKGSDFDNDFYSVFFNSFTFFVCVCVQFWFSPFACLSLVLKRNENSELVRNSFNEELLLLHQKHPFLTDFYDWIRFRWVRCVLSVVSVWNRVMHNPSL